MKRMIAFGLACCLILSGCRTQRYEKHDYKRFKTIAQYTDGFEMVDVDTGFTYFVPIGGGSFAPLYNPDGSLHRANGWGDYGT